MTDFDIVAEYAAKKVADLKGLEDIQPIVEATRNLAITLSKRFSSPNLPAPNESVGVTVLKPKTAALFFDRVWRCPGLEQILPNDVSCYGATQMEYLPALLGLVARSLEISDTQIVDEVKLPYASKAWGASSVTRAIAESLFESHSILALPMYDSTESRDAEYQVGHTQVLVAAIEGLQVVDEDSLDVEQILEFRKDASAKSKFRQLRHWADKELAGKPSSFLIDAVSQRLEDYEWALKKHGILTVSELLDPKVLLGVASTAAALAFAGAEFWGALGAAGVVIGKAAVSVTQKLVDREDRKRGQGSEVAFVHELKKLSK
jgi:hypothetical protein